jgi:hypothetical protein
MENGLWVEIYDKDNRVNVYKFHIIQKVHGAWSLLLLEIPHTASVFSQPLSSRLGNLSSPRQTLMSIPCTVADWLCRIPGVGKVRPQCSNVIRDMVH